LANSLPSRRSMVDVITDESSQVAIITIREDQELGRRLKTAGCAGASRSWAHRVFAVRGRGEKQRRNGCSPVPIADSRAQGRLRRGLVEVVRDGLLGAGLDVPVIDPVPATVKVCNQSCDVETLRRHSRLEIPRRRARRRAACGDCGCCR